MPIARRSIIAETALRPGDIVWVPFPFVESPKVRERPALVVCAAKPAPDVSLLWVLMITSAANKGWQGDVSLEDRFGACGLDVPCVVRTAKISTVEACNARRAGRLPDELFAAVKSALQSTLF